MIFHFEQDLQEERRVLKEDQKMHRSKAMKYLMETNRRRRQVTRVPLMEDCEKKKKEKTKSKIVKTLRQIYISLLSCSL